MFLFYWSSNCTYLSLSIYLSIKILILSLNLHDKTDVIWTEDNSFPRFFILMLIDVLDHLCLLVLDNVIKISFARLIPSLEFYETNHRKKNIELMSIWPKRINQSTPNHCHQWKASVKDRSTVGHLSSINWKSRQKNRSITIYNSFSSLSFSLSLPPNILRRIIDWSFDRSHLPFRSVINRHH